jgi:diguanylate cyclase (GGDEF)-like protein/PAS domain S-box-containing protein
MRHPVDPAALIDTMAEGLYVVDRERIISFWNAAAERITGFTAAEAIGRSCGDGLLNHVDEAGESLCGSRCPLLTTMRDGVPLSVRVYAHHAAGHLVPVRVMARALRDQSGAITGAVETFSDDTEATDTENSLRVAQRLASTDHLTGLGNRRSLEQRLSDLMRDGAGEGVAVLALDIDRFKLVNDNHGHAFGDEVLMTVSRTLVNVVGEGDLVMRLGGDEFVIVTPSAAAREVEALAARVRAAVATTPVADAGITLRITVSVGVAFGNPTDSPETLVKRADAAMLEAKRMGRNVVVVSAIKADAGESAGRPTNLGDH